MNETTEQAAPKVEVRGLKVLERASEETLCFEATVVVDGKPFAVATNDGSGGPNNYRPLPASAGTTQRHIRDDVARLNERIAETIGKRTFNDPEAGEIIFNVDLDVLVDDAVTADRLGRQASRLLSRNTCVLVTKDGHEDIEFYRLPIKKNRPADWFNKMERVAADRNPGAAVRVLNERTGATEIVLAHLARQSEGGAR